MGAAPSCMALLPGGQSPEGPQTVVVYETPLAPAAAKAAAEPSSVRLAFAYASRPGTLHASQQQQQKGTPTSFSARRQPLKINQDVVLVRPMFGGCHFLHLFAVFDGHGEDGANASRFARDRVEALLLQELRSLVGGGGNLEQVAGLSPDAITAALRAAFLGTEQAMGRSLEVDDTYSGTTAVVALLVGCRLFVASVGDSRAVLGISGNGGMLVDPLTTDHNPYRADELGRVQNAGGVVMTYGEMMAGLTGTPTAAAAAAPGSPSSWRLAAGGSEGTPRPMSPTSLDPPRVWDKALSKPGCCFTRSLGDAYSKTLGVIAEPEMAWRDLATLQQAAAPSSFVLCLGSDGVFEFLSNEQLLATVASYPSDRPLHACRAVCARSALLGPPAAAAAAVKGEAAAAAAAAAAERETAEEKERRALLYYERDDTTLICIHIHTQTNGPSPQP